MQLQGVRPCGHYLSLYKKNYVPSVKTSTQIDMNRTRLKEFININIYINVCIPDLKNKQINQINKKNSNLNKKAIFLIFF